MQKCPYCYGDGLTQSFNLCSCEPVIVASKRTRMPLTGFGAPPEVITLTEDLAPVREAILRVLNNPLQLTREAGGYNL